MNQDTDSRAWHAAIDALYREVLYRPVDESGYQTYSALLQAGRIDLDRLLTILMESDEHRQNQAATQLARRYQEHAAELVARSPRRRGTSRRDDRAGYLFAAPDPIISARLPPLTGSATEPPRPMAIATRQVRIATVTDLVWLDPNHLLVLYLEDSSARIYRCDDANDRLVLVQSTCEHMAWPETVAINSRRDEVAIAHSGEPGKLSRHRIDSKGPRLLPPDRVLELSLARGAVHGVGYSRDDRFVLLTTIDEPGSVRVMDRESLDTVFELENAFAPMKPKSVAFDAGGTLLTVSYSPNAGRSAREAGLVARFNFDPETGRIDPEPLACLVDGDGLLSVPEVLAETADGDLTLLCCQGNASVIAYDHRVFDAGILRPLLRRNLDLPHGIALDPAGRRLAVTGFRERRVQVFELKELSVCIVVLTDDPVRSRHVETVLVPHLELQGVVDAQLVPAMTGEALQRADIRASLPSGIVAMLSRCSEFMTRKIACALSHRAAWQSSADDRPLLVLEDDAIVSDEAMIDIAERVAACDRRHPGWDILHLYSSCERSARPGAAEPVLLRATDGLQAHHGNVGYVISAAGRARADRLVTDALRNLGPDDLAACSTEAHFALDLCIVRWALQQRLLVLWSERQLVETVGQPSRGSMLRELPSTIHRDR